MVGGTQDIIHGLEASDDSQHFLVDRSVRSKSLVRC